MTCIMLDCEDGGRSEVGEVWVLLVAALPVRRVHLTQESFVRGVRQLGLFVDELCQEADAQK